MLRERSCRASCYTSRVWWRALSEGARLVEQGGVWLGEDQAPIDRDRRKPLKIQAGMILGVGKGNKARAVRVEPTTGKSGT